MRRLRDSLVYLLAPVALLISLPLAAAPALGPAKEKLRYERAPFTVERNYHPTATDLGLPFLTGAKLVQGSVYRLLDEKDQVLSYYASAQLTSPGAPEAVAQEYSRQIAGRPKPELIKDKGGTRWVLAVGSDKETRTVTIRQAKEGCAIELVRVTKPVEPTQPPDTEEPAQPQRPGPGPRGPRSPRTPGGTYNA